MSDAMDSATTLENHRIYAPYEPSKAEKWSNSFNKMVHIMNSLYTRSQDLHINKNPSYSYKLAEWISRHREAKGLDIKLDKTYIDMKNSVPADLSIDFGYDMLPDECTVCRLVYWGNDLFPISLKNIHGQPLITDISVGAGPGFLLKNRICLSCFYSMSFLLCQSKSYYR